MKRQNLLIALAGFVTLPLFAVGSLTLANKLASCV